MMSEETAVAIHASALPAVQQSGEAPIPTFARMSQGDMTVMNHGAVQIEMERAIAEAQGQLILAKKFPRNAHQCRADFLEACSNLEFAEEAFYTVPNRGTGPSIRFAEEAARCYGNFEYGHRELSRSAGKSEVEVFAWDKEKNNHSKRQITVFHILDTKNGPRKLVDQADIDNRIANVASKQMRGRILALMPKALVAEGKAIAKKTLANGGAEKTIAQRVALMVTAFGKFGVTVDHIEAYFKGTPLDKMTADDLAEMTGVHAALRDGAKVREYFGEDAAATDDAPKATAAAIANSSKPAGGETATTTTTTKPAAAKKADPKPAAKAETKAEVKAEVKETAPAVAEEQAAEKPGDEEEPAEEKTAAPAAKEAIF